MTVFGLGSPWEIREGRPRPMQPEGTAHPMSGSGRPKAGGQSEDGPMWWFVGGFIMVLLTFGAVVDWRARRRGHRFRDGAEISREARQYRRDMRAWERGSLGHSGEDLTWTWQHRRGRRGDGGP